MNIAIVRVIECEKYKSRKLDLCDLKLEILPDLPDFIKILECNNNKLKYLPNKMPDSLQTIYCNDNQITKLSDKMPDSLQAIYCNYNQITGLPNKMPISLRHIDCYGNKLKKLPLILRTTKCAIICEDQDNKFYIAAISLLRKAIIKRRHKKRFHQWNICKKLFDLNFIDCSFIIAQYVI